MIIECKRCKSLFRLDEGLLREDGSKVRCSVCKHVSIAYPPGGEPGKEQKRRPMNKSLGETVTLESPPVFEGEENEPLLEDVSESDFEAAFEEEAETKKMQPVPQDQIPEEEEEEFHLEMDYQEEEKVKPKQEMLGAVETKARTAERKPESHAKPVQEVRSKARKTSRSKLPLVLLVIVLLLIGGAGAVVLFAPELVPAQLAFLKGAKKPELKDPGVLRLRFTAVTGSFVQNSKTGQLFVIRGTISNNYSDSRSYILVKGSILDDKGKVVKTKVAYAGNVFTDSELKDLAMDQINQGLRNRTGKGNTDVNIKPQASVPFMIVFEELPENLSEFTVEPVSSSLGQ
jgi:predicted Zn finger-like uncharacterized protein